MALSRRVFLYLTGFVSVLGWLAPTAPAASAPALERPDDLVVVKGWVLRRNDLKQLPRP
jgi:hypothetical protein